MTVRTRFAPSPTGLLHLGNVRTAVFNWLFSRHESGAFVLRIEDTDVARNVPGGEEAILADLRWLGLDWDEGPGVGGPHGPYRQSARDPRYAEAVSLLLERGRAYPCYCSEEESGDEGEATEAGGPVRRYSGQCRGLSDEQRGALEREGRTSAIRFAVPENRTSFDVEDEIYGSISFPANDIDDFIIRRADGRVTYNFAVVVDDLDMEISHVIRGAGHLSNTPKQALLFDAFERPRPVFAHLPTILGPDGGKLSKRRGATAVAELRAQGYPPDAVLNYLSLLGWSHPDEREVLTRKELVEAISLERVGRSDPRVDPEKLRWISAQHLAGEDLPTLTAHVSPFVDRERFRAVGDRLEAAIDAIRTRLSTYGDVNEHLAVLFPEEGPELAAAREALGGDAPTREVLLEVRGQLARVEPWNADTLGTAIRNAGREVGVRGPSLFHPVRRALIGVEKGPDIGKILAAIGSEETSRRLDLTLGEKDV